MAENNNTAGLSQDYIDGLKGEYTAANNCYNEYHKAAQKAEEEYNRAKDWENCIKVFLDKLTLTYNKANGLNSFIDGFIAHGKKVCTTVGYAKEATKILVECMRCLSEDNEKLKKSLKDLREIIDCLNDPVLVPTVSIMKCLDEFKAKIEDGIQANLDAVKKLLELIRCILELEYEICLADTENPEDQTLQGLLNDLVRLKSILDCTYPHGEPASDVDCTEADDAFPPPAPGSCPKCVDDCGGEINAVPHEVNCNKESIKPKYCVSCGNSYKIKLQADHKTASEQRCYAKCVLDHFKSLEQKAKSNRDATKAALDAAEAAKAKCK